MRRHRSSGAVGILVSVVLGSELLCGVGLFLGKVFGAMGLGVGVGRVGLGC